MAMARTLLLGLAVVASVPTVGRGQEVAGPDTVIVHSGGLKLRALLFPFRRGIGLSADQGTADGGAGVSARAAGSG